MTSAEVNTQQPQQQLEQEGKQPRRVMEPMEVGWQFVQEYYSILNREPSRLHRFYSNESFMIHGVEGETVKPCKGQHEIHVRFKSLNFADSKVLISSVDSLSSLNGGVIVSVLGEIETKGDPARKFSQTFFLASQPNGYFVLNDIFRYLKEDFEEENTSVQEETPAEQPAVVEKDEWQPEPVITESEAVPEPVVVAEETKKQPEPVVVEKPVEKPTEPASAEPAAVQAKPVEEEKPKRGPTTWASLAVTHKERWAGQVSQVKGQAVSLPVPESKPKQQQQAQPKQQAPRQPAQQQQNDSKFSVLIRGFPKDMRVVQIKEEVIKIAGPVQWVDLAEEGTAYIIFNTPEQHKKFLEMKQVTIGGSKCSLEDKQRPGNRGFQRKGGDRRASTVPQKSKK